ncbi:MAG: ribonuclease P protein component [Alphaproteobacteria bacterium]|jgi:ribonuclease P protein component|nr:ribonuclease P protein component [Alphaproteobacteria bacterium]
MKHKTIRNHKDFIADRNDIHVGSDCFSVKIKKQSVPGETRYGLVVSKKIFNTAVKRNLAKRKIRDWIHYNEEFMNLNMDYIFFVNEKILDYSRDLGYKDMRKAMEKITKIYNDTHE